MIILLLNLEPDFENIKKQILTRAGIQNFDEALGYFVIPPPNTYVMVSQSHSQSDSRGGRGNNRGRGQRLHCTYGNRLGNTRDRSY